MRKKFLLLSILICLSLAGIIFAKHLCTDTPLTKFADGSTEKKVTVPPGTGASIKLPSDSHICFAKLKIDFSGAPGVSLTPYLWVPVSGADQLKQIKISDGTIVHTFVNGSDNCAGNAFSNPSRITTIPGGEVWVANRKWAPGPNDGSVTRLGIVGSEYKCLATYSGFANPTPNGGGVTYDKDGNVWYGPDYQSNQVCRFRKKPAAGCGTENTTFDGEFCYLCKNIPGLGGVYGMIGDRSGNVWISDRQGHRLWQCSGNVNCTAVVNFGGDWPYGIGIDNDDHIWIVRDNGSGKFCEYQPSTGALNCYSTPTGGSGIRGIAVDGNNFVWIADSGTGEVKKFDHNGNWLCSAPVGGTPIGVAIDAGNNAWVVCQTSGMVYQIDQNCNVIKSVSVGDSPYNYSDMTGFRTPKIGTQIGTAAQYYSFTPTNFPYTICSEARPEIGCNPTDTAHVLIDTNFDDKLTDILANCSGGNLVQKEEWCGNFMCEVPITLSAVFIGGEYTLSDLQIEWEEPSSKLSGGFVPCGRLCDDPNTPIFEDCPCRLCHFLILGDKIVKFALFRIAVPIAVLMVVIGGAMFLSAGGSPEKISSAKNLIKNVVFGMVIIFAAWIIVNTIFMLIGLAHWTGPAWAGLEQAWWKIDCPVPGNYLCTPPGGGAPVVCTQDTTKSTPNYCKLPWEP
jgi:hypothetical protein